MGHYSKNEEVKIAIANLIELATFRDLTLSKKKLILEVQTSKLNVPKKMIVELLSIHQEQKDIKIEGDDIIPLRHEEMIEKRKQEVENAFKFKQEDDEDG